MCFATWHCYRSDHVRSLFGILAAVATVRPAPFARNFVNLAQLALAISDTAEEILSGLDCLFFGVRLQDGKPVDDLLGLAKWSVRDGHLAVGAANPRPLFYFLLICSAKRCSCSLSSGVRFSPKSAASNTGRISISIPPSKGARLSHSTASSIERTCQIQ